VVGPTEIDWTPCTPPDWPTYPARWTTARQ